MCAAVVTIREQNASGEYFARTAAVLQKGTSFGELALIYGGKRSATVTCKDNVELLAVGRDDYIDIFMHRSRDGGEPEHIKFLKDIKVFGGWPFDSLPLDDPSVFVYTYVRRGMVLCKDSNKTDWIYVIKSGSCRVLTALHTVKPSIQLCEHPWDHSKDITLVSGPGSRHPDDVKHLYPDPPPPHTTRSHRDASKSPRLCPLKSRDKCKCPHNMTKAFRLPSITSRTDHQVEAEAEKHMQQLDEILRKRNSHPTHVSQFPDLNSGSPRRSNQSSPRSKGNRIFVNLLTLQPKDVYGLDSVVLSVFKQPTSTSLVSDGAECIMISKKFFQQKLTEDVAKRIRREIRPLPSEDVLQDKLQTQTDWNTYRSIMVSNFVDFRKHIASFQVPIV